MSYITNKFDKESWPLMNVQICDIVSGKCKQGVLLIDTWASHTSIRQWFLDEFWLTPIDAINMMTPSTKDWDRCICYVYQVKIWFSDHELEIAQTTVTESPLFWQWIDWLLGRDVLQHALLSYDGKNWIYSLAF